MPQTLDVKDVTVWELEEKELYDPEEVSPELIWNSGGVAIRGGRGKEGLTQKQLAELTGIPSSTLPIPARISYMFAEGVARCQGVAVEVAVNI